MTENYPKNIFHKICKNLKQSSQIIINKTAGCANTARESIFSTEEERKAKDTEERIKQEKEEIKKLAKELFIEHGHDMNPEQCRKLAEDFVKEFK